MPQPVQEVKPDVYYLRDQDGRLVPVPNFSYDEFRQLLQSDLEGRAQGTAPPSFALQELTITGRADGTRAELTATITLRVSQSGWVRVPLRCNEAILRQPPEYQGDGEFFLSLDPDNGGHVCWLHGSPDKSHQLSLRLVAPVREVGNELRLSLQLPRAASANLDLRVAIPDALATVNGGLLEIQRAEGETRFLVTGVAGDFQIAWNKVRVPLTDTRPSFRADVKSMVRVEDLRNVTGDVRVNVTCLRGEVESFNIRLPPGTQLLPTQPSASGYRLTQAAAREESQGTVVQVKLDRPRSDPGEIQLLTEITPTGNGKLPEFEAGGVEVEDAIRQAEVIDVVVDGDLSVTWKPGPNVQRTVPPETLRDTVAARFESFRRAYSLRIQVAPQETQMSVDPSYVLQVEATQVRLTATLKYKVRGTPAYGVNIQLPNWRVEQVGPDFLVDADALDRDKREPLQIPLKAAAVPDSGEFTLYVEAVQEIADRGGAISIALPRPEAKASTRAIVAVVPADNVELTIADSDQQDLEREPFPPPLELPVRQQTPQFLRERSDVKSAVLGATLRLRARAVSVAARVRVQAERDRLHVRQQLNYRIAYEPLRALELRVPRAVLASGTLTILTEDQALPFDESASDITDTGDSSAPPAGASGDQPVRIQVDLLAERIGPLEIVLQYDVPTPAPGLTGASPARVPLPVPVAGEDTMLTVCRLDIGASQVAHIQVADEGWEREASPERPESGQTYVSRSFPTEVDLLIARLDQRRRTSTVWLQAWFQTQLAATERRDRAVFRVLTDEQRILFRPADGGQVDEILLDGRRIRPDQGVSGLLAIGLPRTATAQEHVVEIWQTVSQPRPSFGQVSLALPSLQGAGTAKQMYWELVLPASEHLLLAPANLTPEMTWQGRGLLVERRPVLDQRAMEAWIGASRQPPLSDSSPRYLFSGFGEVGGIDVTIAQRGTIVLTLSGIALGWGLVLIYAPACRHPALFFFAGVATLAMVLAAPDLAAATAQASLLGLALALLAWALKIAVDHRAARRTRVRGGVRPSVSESKTARIGALTESKHDAPAPFPSTTATSPLEVPLGGTAP